MTKKYKDFLKPLMLAAFSFGSFSLHSQPVSTPSAPAKPEPKYIGEMAPALSISDWLKGNPVTEFQKGKIYVVEFWATWCLPCIAGMPHLSELAEKYKKDITVIGVDASERSGVTVDRVKRFVDSMGAKMNYNVALDQSKGMGLSWIRTFQGNGAIPSAFIIDKQGRVAWIGLPKNLDKPLAQIIAGKWDITKAAADHKELKRLTELDNNYVVTSLNPLVRDSIAMINKINEILQKEPGLKYRYKTAHFTLIALAKTDPKKLVEYARTLFATTDDPPYKTVTDFVPRMKDMPAEVYVLAADAYQAQLDQYPWSMNFPATYRNMAELYTKAGNPKKAEELTKMAENYKKPSTNH